MKKQLLLLPLFLIVISFTTLSQSITELGFLSPLISTFDMKYTGNHLVISQQGLKIFDVSNPANPQQVGTATYPGSYAYQLAVNGNHAYMAEGGSGYFSVYNISNFTAPALTGSVIIASSAFITGGDLIINGNTAYMTGADSLYTIDVTNPSVPSLANTIKVVDTSFGSASSMAVNGSTLYLLHTLGITAYDISNPLSPAPIDTIHFTHPYYNNGLAVDTINQRLFAPWLSTLQTDLGYDAYDISNPASPAFLFSDSVPFNGGEFGVTDYYNNLLVISKGGGVNMFDVSPSTHSFLTSFTGQNVPNSSVSIEFRDSVFYNMRRGGFEILRYNGGFPTAVNELVNTSDDVNIYPNPVINEIKLINASGNFADGEIKVLNANGQMILDKQLKGEASIALNAIKPGIYFLQYKNLQSVVTKKFVVTF